MIIFLFLPPELFGWRRTTCSRLSLITFSSSSSDRASAISPFFSFYRLLLFEMPSLLCFSCITCGKWSSHNRDSGNNIVRPVVSSLRKSTNNSGQLIPNSVNFTNRNAFQCRINNSSRYLQASVALKCAVIK